MELNDLYEDGVFVGGVYDMSYNGCIVQTQDNIKVNESGGLPEHGILIAEMDDDIVNNGGTLKPHVLVLRIIEPAKLPDNKRIEAVRYEQVERKILDKRGVENLSEADPLSKRESQRSALKAEILGTIYDDNGELKFGQDAHTVISSGQYLAYKPEKGVLEKY